MLTIGNHSIQRIAVIDDDQSARESYGDAISGLEVEPYLESGPIRDIDEFLGRMASQSQAIVCDYRLRKRNYAASDGNAIVEACYRRGFPAILCTSFADYDITLSRRQRQFIPVLLSPREVSPDSIAGGIDRCIQEYGGQFPPSREPARTLVRVDEIVEEGAYLYVVLPGWDPVERIRLSFDDVPSTILDVIRGGARRVHTEANIGAERSEDLYLDFSKWEAQ